MAHLSAYQQRLLDYTEEVKKLEIWELSIEIQAQAETRLHALEYFGQTELPEHQLDLELANQYIFICAAEIVRRQIP